MSLGQVSQQAPFGSSGLVHQGGGHFGSPPAHGPSFPIPPGAAGAAEPAVPQLGCGCRGRSPGQVSAMMCFAPACQSPGSTTAPWTEHLKDYAAPAARSEKALFVLKTPAREQISSCSKKRGLCCDQERKGGSSAWVSDSHKAAGCKAGDGSESVLTPLPGMPRPGQSLQPLHGSAPQDEPSSPSPSRQEG